MRLGASADAGSGSYVPCNIIPPEFRDLVVGRHHFSMLGYYLKTGFEMRGNGRVAILCLPLCR